MNSGILVTLFFPHLLIQFYHHWWAHRWWASCSRYQGKCRNAWNIFVGECFFCAAAPATIRYWNMFVYRSRMTPLVLANATQICPLNASSSRHWWRRLHTLSWALWFLASHERSGDRQETFMCLSGDSSLPLLFPKMVWKIELLKML